MDVQIPIPENEKLRLKKLEYYDIMDTLPEEMFDDITRLAARILDVPIVLISLLDEERQWFKSKQGIDVDFTPREISFCQHAIMGEEIFEVEDALKDERFIATPLVEGDPHIRFYAGTPLRDQEGYNLGTLCAIDQTPKKLSEDQRENLEALGRTVMRLIEWRRESQTIQSLSSVKSRFIARMSHEIRTPLNAIIGLNDILSETEMNNEQTKLLESVSKASKSLLSIVNDVLDISRLDMNDMLIDMSEVNLEEWFDDIVRNYSDKAEYKGLRFESSFDHMLPRRILADRVRLSQIFGNILTEGIRSSEKGTISFKCEAVSLSSKSTSIRFEISDSSSGIQENELDQLFERFSQSRKTEKRSKGNVGLGLAVAKELAEMFGGSVKPSINNRNGVTIEVILSFDKPKTVQSRPVSVEETNDVSSDNPLKILVVEDNEINQIITSRYIERMGAQCTTADDGSKAVELLKKEEFDLILMDLQMPVMDGWEATRIIIDEMDIDTPIIGCSAYSSEEEKTKCLSIGMKDYLCKPFSQEKFTEIYQRHIRDRITL